MRRNNIINIFTHKTEQMLNNIRCTQKSDKNMFLFAYEGVLFAFISNLINNNNNLFATRLGASDFQLTLVIALPQLVAMIVLIPGGILTDRMANKRQMIIISLSSLAVVYFALGFVPIMGTFRLTAFLILLALSVGPMTLYNASWQTYFSDVVPINRRNRTFTLRTKWIFLINIATPLLTGTLLASVTTNVDKLKLHQSFFWVSCIFIIIQIFILKRISGGNESSSKIGLKELKNVILNLIHNKNFLGFALVALFFYMSWESDWTLYYIGQVSYLKFNEAWLSYVTVGGAAVQFITIGFWSRTNERLGIRFSIIMGSMGLCFFPLIMILCTSLPHSIGPALFLVLNILSNFSFATVTLNILQCLLQVIPEKNKTLTVSIYMVFISLSNAVMPMVSVRVYTALGANLRALHITFLMIFIARIVATVLWALRWWILRNDPK